MNLQKLSKMKLLLSFLFILFFYWANAEVKLPQILSSDMVIQRNSEIKIWGWANQGELVKVTFNNQSRRVKTAKDGKWFVLFPAMKEGGPYEMLIAGKKNTISLTNIMIGDVWLLSGQSNMEVTVAKSNYPEIEIKNANYPNIRLLTIGNKAQLTPAEDVAPTDWKICSPENIPGFSGVGYFFGRKLHQETNLPIGLILSAWGGTFAEPWTAEDCLDKYPDIKQQINDLKNTSIRNNNSVQEVDSTKLITLDKDKPAQLFNGMIYPLINLKITGVAWYQGEKNSKRASTYKEIFPNLIYCWRKYWQNADMPFLYVQLANWRYPKAEPEDHPWSEIRDAQLKTLSLPNTGMAVAIDIGDPEDIHPKNKQDVGLRLALNALKMVYGRDIVCQGPIYKSMEIKGNKVVLDFDHKGSGLVAKDKYGYLKGFAIAGNDNKYYWAKAEISDNKVVVYSPKVPSPTSVQYGWAQNPDDVNLYNIEGLPASPFRTNP